MLTFGYKSEEAHFDEEIELYYYRARYYSAELGRFISRDPIGITDDINLYAYVGNNPVMFRDPSGMEKSPIEQVASLSPHYDIGGVLGGVALGTLGLVTFDTDKVNAGNQAVDESMRNIFNPLNKIKKAQGVMKLFGKSKNPIPGNIKKLPDDEILPPIKRGNAPFSNQDGKPIQIHHEGQNPKGPFKEMHGPDHRKIDHNKPGLSQKDRQEFNNFRNQYWKSEWDNGRFNK